MLIGISGGFTLSIELLASLIWQDDNIMENDVWWRKRLVKGFAKNHCSFVKHVLFFDDPHTFCPYMLASILKALWFETETKQQSIDEFIVKNETAQILQSKNYY